MAKKGRPRTSSCARFWPKVNKTDTCWLWQAGCDKDGYGAFKYNDAPGKAHTFSYLLHNKRVPRGMVIDHLCRNPRCVNPEHLEMVSHRENVVRGATVLSKASDLPVGVRKRDTKYQAQKMFNGVNVYLGRYKTPEDASIVYETAVICD